jgi:hypothetical protein
MCRTPARGTWMQLAFSPESTAYLLERHAALMQLGEMNCLRTAHLLDEGHRFEPGELAGLIRDTSKIISSGVAVIQMVAQILDKVEISIEGAQS